MTVEGLPHYTAEHTSSTATAAMIGAAMGLGIVACVALVTPAAPVSNYATPAVATRPVVSRVQPVLPRTARAAYPVMEAAEIEQFAQVQEPQAAGAPVFIQQESLVSVLFLPLAAIASAITGLIAWRSTRPAPMAMAAGFGKTTAKKVKAPAAKKDDQPCPCGSGEVYGKCCMPYHKGGKWPTTPELLFRARYSGFITKEKDFIYKTTDPSHMEIVGKTPAQLKDDINLSCTNLFFEEMQILKEEPGENEDEQYITFRMWYRFIAEFKGTRGRVTRKATERGELLTRTEKSLFRKIGGKWWFIDSPETNNESFRQGDTAEVNTDVMLKARDVASGAANQAFSLADKAKEIMAAKK